MAFDLNGAREEGYTDTQIAEHLSKLHGFNLQGARDEGYDDGQIVEHLAQKSTTLAKAKNVIADTPKSVMDGAQPTGTTSAAVRAGITVGKDGRITTPNDRAIDINVDRALAPDGEAADTMAQTSEFIKGSSSPRIADQDAVTRKPEQMLADATESATRYQEKLAQEEAAKKQARIKSLRVLARSDTPEGANARRILDEEGGQVAAAYAQRSHANAHPVLSDTATDLRSGVAKVPGALTGLLDIAPALIIGGRPADALFNAVGEYTGFRPEEYAQKLEQNYSDIRKQGQRDISAVWDDETQNWWDVTKAYASNPGVTAGTIIQSLPSIAAGGAIGRATMLRKAGLEPAAMQKAAATAGAVGEGSMMAGQQMNEIDKSVDPRVAALASLATGVMGAAVGKYSGALASKLGIRDVDTLMAGGAANAVAMPFYKRIPAAMVQEGIIEEGSQSSMEQMLKNIAEDKPVTEGVARSAVEGALAGSAMGGVVALPPGQEAAPFPDAKPGTLSSAANIAAMNGITPPSVPAGAVPADELLDTPEPTPAAKGVNRSLSILGDPNGPTTQPAASVVGARRAEGPGADAAGSPADGVLRYEAATGTGRDGLPGSSVANDGAGAAVPANPSRPEYVGQAAEIVLPDNTTLSAQWEVVDADEVKATLSEGQNQPRDRSRAASNVQVQGIANKPNYSLLRDSPVMDFGAPTLSQDGAIVGGNGRFEGVSRAYDQNTATEYRARLEADAASKGIDPANFAGMKKPVLVRRITQPFDTRALAVASNSGGSLQYSALEQAKIDGERMQGLGDIEVSDTGDVVMSGDNIKNVRRALTGYTAAELGSLTDKDGMLSQEGIRRIKNALLYKAYGNSAVLSRLVESADPDLKSVMGALVRAAGTVASVRADIKQGAKPASADIITDLLAAVEQLAKLKADGVSIEQFFAQQGMFGKGYSEETAAILRFLSDNIRSQKRMAEFIRAYYDGLANEEHASGSMFDTAPVTNKERLNHVANQTNETAGKPAESRSADEVRAQAGEQSEGAQATTESGGEGQQESGVTGTKAAPVAVETHLDVKLAERNVNTSPTDAQKEAGNYAKAHITWNGLDIAIENPAGSERSGTDADGERWSVTMPASYGYIKRTEGADGDHIDVYLGKHLQSDQVFIIDQKDANTGKFDEHKVMLGFPTLREAERIYKAGFSDGKGGQRMGAVTPMSLGEFKEWIKTDDTTKPAADTVGKARAQADMDAALAEMGDIFRSIAAHNLLPEDKPRLMPVLVKMFDAAFRLGYYEMRDAARYVREQLAKLDKRMSTFIPKAWLDEAAQQAQKNMPAGFFENQGLFGQSTATAKVEQLTERRAQPRLRLDDLQKNPDIMTQDEVREVLLRLRQHTNTNPLTGLPSKAVWDTKMAEGHGKKFVASIDADALKWFNDNIGHETGGNVLLNKIGTALIGAKVDAYHISGDEFYAMADSQEELDAALKKAQNELSKIVIEGNGWHVTGAGFSYGIATDIGEAEHGLHANKTQREAAGLRSPRGDTPGGAIQTDGANESGRAEAGNQAAARHPQGTADRFALESHTNQEVLDAEARREQAGREEEARIRAQAAARAARDQADLDAKIKARTDNSDNFQFGESSKDAAKPVGDLFNQPKAETSTPEAGNVKQAEQGKQSALSAIKSSDIPKSEQIKLAADLRKGDVTPEDVQAVLGNQGNENAATLPNEESKVKEAAAPQQAKPETIIIDGLEYDADAENFGLAPPPKTLRDDDPLLVSHDKDDTTERNRMRTDIVDYYFNDVVPPVMRRPIAYIMGGGGASGKGTIRRLLAAQGIIPQNNVVHLDPDDIKDHIPEYGKIIEKGDSRAAAVVHEESSALAKRIKARAIAGQYDMVYDVTLGDPAKAVAQLQELKDAGYEIRLFGATIGPATAIIRADKRARRPDGGRYVPSVELLKAHKNFPLNFEKYAALVDEAVLYENTDTPIEIAMFSKARGLDIINKEEYNEVLKRSGGVNEQATTLKSITHPQATSLRGTSGSMQDRSSEIQSQSPEGSRARGREDHGDESGSSEETVAQNENRTARQGSLATQGAATDGGTAGERKSGSVHPGALGRNIVANRHPADRDSQKERAGQDGKPAGTSGNPQQRKAGSKRDRTGGTTGVPAGRDIPSKSGLNYHFTDADLDYKGSWITKAKQNIDAIELVKKLKSEKRNATREEQAVLAKFIGWGASDIRNNVFDKKLDEQLATLSNYDEAITNLGDKQYLTNANYSQYRPAFEVLRAKNPALNWYTAGNITKAMLDAAKPDNSVREWGKLRDRLKDLLTAEEWETAERSTQYAHYTGKEVVNEMWRALDRFGFKGGAIIEPGAGNGVFPGLMPAAVANNSIYTGIEYDALTGAILKHLQPDERILVESYIESALPDNFYDVAIGNPPFADVKVLSDPKYKKHAFALHDYFFAKTMDKVKPGGLVMFVTSRYTMDKQGDKARQYLAERADLLGAIRLPETAFKKNAGTEVVTDILFLRKKVPGETFEGHGWMGLDKIKVKGGEHLINEYFAKHPEMVLGEGAIDRNGRYAKNQYTVLPNKSVPITELLAKAVDSLPKDVYRPEAGTSAQAAQVREFDWNPKAKKEGNYYVADDGRLMQLENRIGVPADKVAAKQVPMVKDFVKLRDALNQTQYDQLNDGDWETSLKALQKEYKSFVAKHGNILQNTVIERKSTEIDEDTGESAEVITQSRRFDLLNKLNDDPDYTKVMALESINDETGEIKESDFLSKRVLEMRREAEISTPHDALLSVLNDIGRVDIPTIAERIDLTEKQVIEALGTSVYELPNGTWVMQDEYLSGNVKKKLKEAQEAVKSDKRFERNVEALLSAQPAPVSPADITAALGMNWIPMEVYEQFLLEKTGVTAKIEYNEHTGSWRVDALKGHTTPQATTDWGTPQRNAADILEAGLTGRPIRVTRSEGSGKDKKTVFDQDATEAANQKLREMREAFKGWMWQDTGRTDKLVALYNDKFNTMVARKFDGRHLTLPGTTSTIKVFDHVKRGAWRIIQSGNTYLAHAVGSGKTWEMVIAAMEQRRLGLVSKPMMVVPNHMLQQFAQEWLQLYPAARLMVADEKQFHTDNRRRFVARAAMSDLDGIIITHSAFKLLDLDPDFKEKMIREQLDYLEAALSEVETEEGEKSRSPRVREIQNRIEKLEERLKAMMNGEGKDKSVRFDEMGVDQLFVDEAHEYRKLAFTTTRQVKGISSTGSERAFDLYMKTRWLESKKPGRSLVMASGTPITNTIAEIYSVQRFMAPQVLEERGLHEFDSWASMFGEEHTAIEADASGKYAPVTRFSRFVNVPELTQMFREFADVLTSDHLAEMLGDKRPKVEGGGRQVIVTPEVPEYLAYKKELSDRLAVSRRWKPSKDEPNNPDPVIRIIGDGRLAAIDMRFIDPSLPSNPNSKLNKMIDDVIADIKETSEWEYKDKNGKVEPIKGATQMVFSDLGFGEGVAAHRGFNARAWFEKRMRDAGIPTSKFAFMSDHKKSDAKVKLFRDVNAGRVRLLTGSSKNMGTGVNAQQRLLTINHLDTPWFPADLEQREGRGVRQGNKNTHVRLRAYATKGSYDSVMWQMLASKQRFINQALSGDSSVRTLDDISEVSQFEMATALTADDPRAIQLAGLKSDIERYQRLYRAHEENRMRAKESYALAGNTIKVSERNLPEIEKLAAKVQNLSGENFAAKAGKRVFDTRKEWGEALLAKFADYFDATKDGIEKIGEISGFDVMVSGKIIKDMTDKVKGYDAWVFVKPGAKTVTLVLDKNDDPVGVAMRATNALTALKRTPDELRQTIADAKAKRAALVDRLDTPFQFAAELASKTKEAADLEAAMVVDSTKAEQEEAGKGEPDKGVMTSQTGKQSEGMAAERVEMAVTKLRNRWVGFRRIKVVQSVRDIPDELYLRALRDLKPVDNATDGLYDEATRTVYLIADNLASPERAVWVAAHEVRGHGGLRMLGGLVDDAVNRAAKNPYIMQLGRALAADWGQTFDERIHAEEAIAELAAATETNRVDAILARYGVKVPMAMRGNLLGMVKRVLEAVRDFMAKALGKPVSEVPDREIYSLLRRMAQVVQGKDLPKEGRSSGGAVYSSRSQSERVTGMGDVSIIADFRNDMPLKRHADYQAAKAGSIEAAVRLVSDLVKPENIAAAKEKFGDDVAYLPVMALEASGENQIPNALANHYAEQTGGALATGIFQTNKAYHTGADAMERMIARSEFGGEVIKGQKYVLVDDVSTMGGTLADLASYIQSQGGVVSGTVLLTNASRSGSITPDAKIIRSLETRHGQAIRELFGIKPGALTRDEAQYLIGFRTTDELRNRAAAASAERSRRILSKAKPETKNSRAPVGPTLLTSRAPAQTLQNQPKDLLRPAKAASMEKDTSLLDKVVAAPFKIVQWNRIFEPAFDRVMDLAGEFVPEKIKAGMVADYGLNEDYIDRKAEMKAAEAAQNRKSAGLVEMLAALTRAESRVAYQWMNEKPDTATEQALLERLPADSRAVLARLKKMISDLGKEAVRLGQLSPEAYERNNMAYLNRTYAKHVLDPQGAIGKMLRMRAIKIKGNQYKGRGIFDEVKMDAVGGGEGFGRKLQQGRADNSLVGEKVIRFERRDASSEAMDALPGMTRKQLGKLKEVIYWTASTPVPPKFGDWVNSGTFEVRGTKGDKLVVWRDFTKDEREHMGELDEVRYATAQTLQMMAHDIEVGRFFEWTAKQYGKVKPEGKEAPASESMLKSYGKDEWARVPTATIPGTQTKKYGALAGLYVPGPVWNDIRQSAGTRIEPFGHAHEKLLQFWKKAKTAWSPAVHMNNVMANFVIADWHDLRAMDLAEALKVWAYNKQDGYRELYQRFEDSGALGGMFLSNEALRDEIKKQLEAMKAELTGEQEAKNEMARMAKVLHLVTMAGMVPVKGGKAYTSKMEDAYQFEDAIFRLAAFTKALRYGKNDIEAGRIARHSFLNYDINAPWIQMARHTALPFVSFFYRALPMAVNTVKSKPWKIVKLMGFYSLVSALGSLAAGGDDDEERRLMPDEKSGSVWGVVPKMVRMPWNHDDDAPYYLDIRRWVPVGDVADMEMGAGMLPPWATPSGPLLMLSEVMLLNKSMFTEKEIVLDTDTGDEKLEKRLDHLFKGMMPNVPLPNPLNMQIGSIGINPLDLKQGSLQTYGWSGIEKAVNRQEGTIGEVRTTPAAIASALGVKLSAYPASNMETAIKLDLRRKINEIEGAIDRDARDYSRLENPTAAQERAKKKMELKANAKIKRAKIESEWKLGDLTDEKRKNALEELESETEEELSAL